MRVQQLAVILLATFIISPGRTFAQNNSMQNKTSSAATDAAKLPPINYAEYRLDNGLRVILHEDHSTPIVAVNIWYHVGSKNEVPGRTGFAHLFEHMMFQGSKHYDGDYFVPLQEAGGGLNGSTNSDRTNYWEVVPSNFLELALWLESDRMGFLLDALTDEKLTNQRDVVKNEKRQNYDNRPYGLVPAKIASTMYPPEHPYHWLTIGELEDIAAATREDVSEFFRRFYTPNNASLVIAGDFDPAQTRRLVEKYFGPLKRGPEVKPVAIPQPKLDKEIRITMDDRVSLPRLYITWNSMPQFTKDEAALDTLATVLTNGKGSRLYRSLVYEKQIAQEVAAFNNTREIAGQFQIVVTAKPGKTLEEVERAVNEELDKLKAAPPSAEELDRAYNARESSIIYGMQTIGGFGGKSDQLNMYAVYLNEPSYFQQDLGRYRVVTGEEVMRVTREYLSDKRFVLSVVPRAKTNGTSGTTSSPQTTTPSSTGKEAGPASAATTAPTPAPATAKTKPADQSSLGGLYVQPKQGPDPKFNLPRLQRRKLSNGLEVLIVEQHELPVVNLSMVVKAGGTADPMDRGGLASLTAALIDEGTKSRTSLEISNQLADVGASLGTGAEWDLSGVNVLSLAKHLDRVLEIYSDVIINPSFPEAELKLQRAQRLAALLQRRDNANAIASVAFSALLYGDNHPYGHPLTGDEDSIKAIARADIDRFYQTFYRPNNCALIIVGDVKPDALMPKLERAFAAWQPGEIPASKLPAAMAREMAGLYLVDKPGAAQSVVTIGQVGVARSTPDYFPLLVMNTMLGGQFTSRINMNLREDKGYTYGARTGFDFRIGAGPFAASAGVQTAVTTESVIEFLKELRGIRGATPVTAAELDYSKQAIIRGYPRGFETSDQIANRLTSLVVYKLPDSYFNDFIPNVQKVTKEDVMRVASTYLDPSKMAILIVGDRKVVEARLRTLEAVGTTLSFLDTEGHPISGGDDSGGGGAKP